MYDGMTTLRCHAIEAEEKLKAIELKLSKLEAKLNAELQEAKEKLKEAEEKAKAAEARAIMARSRAKAMELELTKAKEDASSRATGS